MIAQKTTYNFIFLFLGRIVVALGGLIIVILISREGGMELLGHYTYLTATMAISMMLSNFGMDIFITRSVAQYFEKIPYERLSVALWLQLTIAFMIILAITCSTLLLNFENSLAWHIYSLILIPASLSSTSNAVLKGNQKMGYLTLSLLVEALTQIIGVFLCVKNGIVAIVIVLVCAKILGASFSILSLFREKISVKRLIFSSKKKDILPIVKSGWHLSVSIFFNTISLRAAVILLGVVSGNYEIGLYGASNKVIEAIKMIPTAIYGSLFPEMVKKEKERKSTRDYIKYVFLAALGATVVLFFIAPILVHLLYKNQEITPVLQIMLIGLLPFIVRQFLSFRLFAQGRDKLLIYVSTITCALMIVSCYLGNQFYGLFGLCWAVNGVWTIEWMVLMLIQKNFRLLFK